MPNSVARLNEIQMAAEDALRNYQRSESGKTQYLRAAAEAFISAREHFFTADGTVDWLGRSYAYRQWVGETMSNARIKPEDMSNVQSAIRYHAGNVLRSRLDDEQLEDLGLLKSSAKERAAENRTQSYEIRWLFGGGGAISGPEEILQAVKTMSVTFRRITDDSLPGAKSEIRAELAEALAEITARAEELTAVVAAPSRRRK